MLKAVGVQNVEVLHFFDGWSVSTVVQTIAFNWVFKVMFEVVMTPFTYLVCNWLKRAEGVDHYDCDTNFNPFSLKD
jgi:uncharacterized PurR-regulated membrane protein YhhQ (DUF165 family)